MKNENAILREDNEKTHLSLTGLEETPINILSFSGTPRSHERKKESSLTGRTHQQNHKATRNINKFIFLQNEKKHLRYILRGHLYQRGADTRTRLKKQKARASFDRGTQSGRTAVRLRRTAGVPCQVYSKKGDPMAVWFSFAEFGDTCFGYWLSKFGEK